MLRVYYITSPYIQILPVNTNEGAKTRYSLAVIYYTIYVTILYTYMSFDVRKSALCQEIEF